MIVIGADTYGDHPVDPGPESAGAPVPGAGNAVALGQHDLVLVAQDD